MLNCAATCRGRDKKPGDNRLEVSSVINPALINFTETKPLIDTTIKECDALGKIMNITTAKLPDFADLLNGEPYIAALGSNADCNSGLIRRKSLADHAEPRRGFNP